MTDEVLLTELDDSESLTELDDMVISTRVKPESQRLEKNGIRVKVGSLKCRVFIVDLEDLQQEAPLFRDELTSDKTVSSGELVITDITPRGFSHFLGYLTTGQISCKTLEECQETWEVANKYKITEFDTLIIVFLSGLLSPSNACDVYNIAKHFSNSELEKLCLNLFTMDTFKVINSNSFKRAKKEFVEKIVSSEEINRISELELFTALVQWGKEEVIRQFLFPTPDTVRVVLEPLLKHIRFLDMTPEEFVLHVVPERILTALEEHAVLIRLTVPNERTIPIPKPLNSCHVSRRCNTKTLIPLSTISKDKIQDMVYAFYSARLEADRGTFYLREIEFPFTHEGDTFHATIEVTFRFNTFSSRDDWVNQVVCHGSVVYSHDSYRFPCQLLKVREGECVHISAQLKDFSKSLSSLRTTPINIPKTFTPSESVAVRVIQCSKENGFVKIHVVC